MKHEFSVQVFEKCSNIKFHENPSTWGGGAVVPLRRIGGRTLKKLIVAFRNFTYAPKNQSVDAAKGNNSCWFCDPQENPTSTLRT